MPNIVGSFLDKKGKKYFFDAYDKKDQLADIKNYFNFISLELLWWIKKIESLLRKSWDYITTSLTPQLGKNVPNYIDMMEENKWFLYSTVFEMLNCIYSIKIWWWLIVSYENLFIDPDWRASKLFDGSCKLECQPISPVRDMGKNWLGHKIGFSIKQDKKILISGVVTYNTNRP